MQFHATSDSENWSKRGVELNGRNNTLENPVNEWSLIILRLDCVSTRSPHQPLLLRRDFGGRRNGIARQNQGWLSCVIPRQELPYLPISKCRTDPLQSFKICDLALGEFLLIKSRHSLMMSAAKVIQIWTGNGT